MSSDNTDSAPIDDKKTESQPDTSSMDIKGFIKNYVYSIKLTPYSMSYICSLF